MESTQIHIPHEAYELTTEHNLGELIRVYCSNKRSMFKTMGWVSTITFGLVMAVGLFASGFDISRLELYGIVVGLIMVCLFALVFLIIWLIPKSTIYICARGFLYLHGRLEQSVRWEEVEWVSVGSEHRIVYLTNKKRVVLQQLIEQLDSLAQEIEIKARLIRSLDASDDLEQQFEYMLARQAGQQQEKENLSAEKQALIAHEDAEEAFKLREEYQLGDVLGTYHAGFKGIMRKEFIILPIHYTLLLSFALVVIGSFLRNFLSSVEVLASHSSSIFPILFILSSFFMPRAFARYVRLHLYTNGFIYIAGGVFEIVRWEEVEKVIYHKHMPVFSPPFCSIYVKNGDKLALSGYMHTPKAIKRVFDERVVNKIQVG